MKILIVDDERFVIRGIRVLLEREGLDMEILCAYNGLEALKAVEANHPDIIVTDVRMPVMDGLEFCRELKEKGIVSKIIIISGYQEFEYARKAMEYSVRKYVLKPINHSEFAQVLHETVKELENERRNEERDRLNQEIVKKKFLADAILGISDLPSAIDEMKAAGMEPVKTEYVLALMAVTISMGTMPGPHDKTGLSFTAAFEKMASSYPYYMIFSEYRPREYIMLLEVKKQELKPVNSFLCTIINKCNSAFGTGCSMGVSAIHTVLDEMEAALLEVRQAIKVSFLEGNGRPQFFGDEKYSDFFAADISEKSGAHTRLVGEVEQRILASLEDMNLKECIVHVNYFFDELRRQKSEFGQIHMAVLALYIGLSRCMAGIGHNMSEILSGMHITYETLSNYRNLEDLSGFLMKVVRNMLTYMENGHKNRKHGDYVVNEVKKIVRDDLQNATLEYAADKMGMSPVYLSILFKQHTNTNFKQYLLDVRVNYAKALLKNSNKKISEISSKIGYSNAKYFCRMFKKVTGLSPSDYRIGKGFGSNKDK